MLHVNAGYDRSSAHHHATVAEARACEEEVAYQDWEAKSEAAMELATERYFEEGTDAQRAARFAENEEERWRLAMMV